jgi:hypothetical protein
MVLCYDRGMSRFDLAPWRRVTALGTLVSFTVTFGGCSHSQDTTSAPTPIASIATVTGSSSAAAGFASAPASGASSAAEPVASGDDAAPVSSGDEAALSVRYADAAAAIPADRYDLDARAAELAPGVDAAFALARDEIRVESYSGALLGASGAYRNRGANSIDRAALLYRLLTAKHIPARYASCRLDATAAEALATRLFTPPSAPATSAPVAVTSAPDPLYARIVARGERDLAAVKSALGGTPAYTGMSHADLIAELEDHTWIQANPSGSAWIDLDPSFADASPGKSYCAATTTVATPPQSSLQTVTFRVNAETLNAGALSQRVLLEQTLPAFTLLDKQIYVAQQPAAGFNVGFSDTSLFAPFLAVDGQTYPGTAVSFTDGGGGSGGASKLAKGIADAFGPAAATSSAPSTGPYLVAEWLEITVRFPDGKSDTSRRYLFDRGGMAWRASADHDPAKLIPMRTDANGPLAAQSVHEICLSAGRHDVRSYEAALAAIHNAVATKVNASPAPAASGSGAASPDLFAMMWPFALRNLAFAMVGDEQLIPALNDRPDVRFYADSPRIFVFGAGLDPKTGAPYLDSDFRRDSLRAVARDPSGASAVAEGTLKFGVMEGALEAELAAPPAALRSTGDSFGSTSDLLGTAGLTVLRPGADLGAVADPETAARLHAALLTGATLVVPTEVLRGGQSGWWEIASDASRVRAVYGEDLGGTGFAPGGGATGLGPGSSNYINSAGNGDLVWNVNPQTLNSVATRNGQVVNYGNYGAPKPAARGGGGEMGEYATLLTAILCIGAPVMLTLGLIVYYFLVKKPYLEATYGAGTAPL